MSENLIKTIHKVRITEGKWTEFWFKEDLESTEIYNEQDSFNANESFHACMKTYSFLTMLGDEGINYNYLGDDISISNQKINDEFKNRKTIWKRSQYDTHYEFVSMLKETRIVLFEKVK